VQEEKKRESFVINHISEERPFDTEVKNKNYR
jgi:hypothetical protein